MCVCMRACVRVCMLCVYACCVVCMLCVCVCVLLLQARHFREVHVVFGQQVLFNSAIISP